jgi:hypothetical protein
MRACPSWSTDPKGKEEDQLNREICDEALRKLYGSLPCVGYYRPGVLKKKAVICKHCAYARNSCPWCPGKLIEEMTRKIKVNWPVRLRRQPASPTASHKNLRKRGVRGRKMTTESTSHFRTYKCTLYWPEQPGGYHIEKGGTSRKSTVGYWSCYNVMLWRV